jgi:hypothetical protein
VSCSILNAFVVNGLHSSNFLNISLIIEGIIMQPEVVSDPIYKRVYVLRNQCYKIPTRQVSNYKSSMTPKINLLDTKRSDIDRKIRNMPSLM